METNRHHMLWPRRKMHTGTERDVREALCIHGVWIPAHEELHNNLAPPLKPSKMILERTLEVLDDQFDLDAPASYEADLEKIPVTIDLMQKIGSDESLRFARHIEKQLGYLTLRPAEVAA